MTSVLGKPIVKYRAGFSSKKLPQISISEDVVVIYLIERILIE